MEFLRRLVAQNYIDQQAVNIAQAERDPPTHGVGLRPAGQRPADQGRVSAAPRGSQPSAGSGEQGR